MYAVKTVKAMHGGSCTEGHGYSKPEDIWRSFARLAALLRPTQWDVGDVNPASGLFFANQGQLADRKTPAALESLP
jgi:hypothetical protein